jgi:hypothetical protein
MPGHKLTEEKLLALLAASRRDREAAQGVSLDVGGGLTFERAHPRAVGRPVADDGGGAAPARLQPAGRPADPALHANGAPGGRRPRGATRGGRPGACHAGATAARRELRRRSRALAEWQRHQGRAPRRRGGRGSMRWPRQPMRSGAPTWPRPRPGGPVTSSAAACAPRPRAVRATSPGSAGSPPGTGPPGAPPSAATWLP